MPKIIVILILHFAGIDCTTEVPSYECFLPWTDQPSTLAEINQPEVTLRQSQNVSKLLSVIAVVIGSEKEIE